MSPVGIRTYIDISDGFPRALMKAKLPEKSGGLEKRSFLRKAGVSRLLV